MNWGLPEQRIGLVCASPRPIPADLELPLMARTLLWCWWDLEAWACPFRGICFSSGPTTISCCRLQQMVRKNLSW